MDRTRPPDDPLPLVTRPDLDAIAARVEAATPGPWTACGNDRGGCQCRQVRDADCTVAVAIANTDESYTLGDGWDVHRAKHNASLIANARTDIPALLAYVRHLETALHSPALGHRCADGVVRSYPAVVCAKGCGGEAVDLVGLVGELEAALAWHEDRHGTRAEQEADDAEAEEEWSAVAALSDDEVRALNEAEGLDSPAQRQRFDTFLRVLAREAALRAERDELLATIAAMRAASVPA